MCAASMDQACSALAYIEQHMWVCLVMDLAKNTEQAGKSELQLIFS